MDRAEFEARWSGQLVLLARRASLGDRAKEFNLTWFLQAIHKYRWILSEVLAASFFLQLFALITTIFFQVVIDKVLVHRGLTMLDVLIFGLITVLVFKSLLGALRTYIFHTRPIASMLNSVRVSIGISRDIPRDQVSQRMTAFQHVKRSDDARISAVNPAAGHGLWTQEVAEHEGSRDNPNSAPLAATIRTRLRLSGTVSLKLDC